MTVESEMLAAESIGEAEKALVGLALHNATVLDEVGIVPEDFHNLALEHLWRLMLRLRSDGETPDHAHVVANLASLPIRTVQPIHIADLHLNAPLHMSAERYARLISKASTRRRLAQVGASIVRLGEDQSLDPEEALELARAEVDSVSRQMPSVFEMDAQYGSWLATLGDAPQFIPTPWPDLNAYLGGFRPGALYVVGARPSVGKSIFGLQAAMALQEHGHVPLHSLEMSREEVFERITANVASVPLGRLNGTEGRLTRDDMASIRSHAGEVAAMRLAVDDRGGVNMNQIRAYVRTTSRKGPLAGLVVDYIGLMGSTERTRSRQEEVAANSRALKNLAKEFNIPVIALSQLNRQAEGQDEPPNMSHLRESGALEQDANVVLLLHMSPEVPGVMLVEVEKNRMGRRGQISLVRQGAYARLATFSQAGMSAMSPREEAV